FALGATVYRAVTGKPPEEATLCVADDRMVPASTAANGLLLSGIPSCRRCLLACEARGAAAIGRDTSTDTAQPRVAPRDETHSRDAQIRSVESVSFAEFRSLCVKRLARGCRSPEPIAAAWVKKAPSRGPDCGLETRSRSDQQATRRSRSRRS